MSDTGRRYALDLRGVACGDRFSQRCASQNRRSAPPPLAFARGDAVAQAFWRRVIEKRDQRDGDLETALRLMRETGALEDTRARAEAPADRARAALAIFPDSPLKAALSDIAGFVVARAY